MDLYFDKEKNTIYSPNGDPFHISIINDLLKDLVAPLKTPDDLIKLLEIIEDPYKGNSDFLYYLIDKIRDNQVKIPSLPQNTVQLLKLLQSEDASFEKYSSIVKLDALIAAKIIRLANTAYYKGNYPVTSIEMAISRIGLKTLKEVILALSFESIVFKSKQSKHFSYQEWKTSVYVAYIASKLAKKFNLSEETVYTIGLLQNIGSFIILSILDEYYTESEGLAKPNNEFVYKLIESFKYKISYIALKEWEFPEDVISVITMLDSGTDTLLSTNSKIIFLSNKLAIIEFKSQLQDIKCQAFYEGLIKKSNLNMDWDDVTEILKTVQKEVDSFLEIFNK